MTQDGIAERLDISTGSVSVHLKRLVDSGCVAYRTEHVKGARTRRRVYLTTPKGEMIVECYRGEGRVKNEGGDGRPERTGNPVAQESDAVDAREAKEGKKGKSVWTYSFYYTAGG